MRDENRGLWNSFRVIHHVMDDFVLFRNGCVPLHRCGRQIQKIYIARQPQKLKKTVLAASHPLGGEMRIWNQELGELTLAYRVFG